MGERLERETWVHGEGDRERDTSKDRETWYMETSDWRGRHGE